MRRLSVRRRGERLDGQAAERGAVLLIVSMLTVVVLGMVAMVVDIGTAAQQKRFAQSIADAASLAAAQDLPGASAATSTALAYVKDNAGVPTSAATSACASGNSCYTVGPWTATITTPFTVAGYSGSSNDLVRVVVCRQSSTSFGTVLGIMSVRVCGKSTAKRESTMGAMSCGLCVLDATGTTLDSSGAGYIKVNNGSIIVNSTSSTAVKISNADGLMQAAPAPPHVFGIAGGYSAATATQLKPTPTTGYAPIPDPLASLPAYTERVTNYGSVSASGSGNLTLSPGIYTSITSSSSGQITLTPGVYVLTGQLKLSHAPGSGGVSLHGQNVLLYFACSSYPAPCSSGSSGGSFSLSGGATVTLSAPNNGTYQGMTIFYDRNNNASLLLTGSSATTFSGTIYAKSASVSLTGPSGVDSAFTSAIVAGDLTRTGSSSVTLNFDASLNTPYLSSPPDVALLQ